jgi:hypothetical protein
MVGTQCRGFRGHRLTLVVAVLSIATKAAAQDASASSQARPGGNERASPPREQLGSQRQLVLSVEGLLSVRAELPRTSKDTYEDGNTVEVRSSSTTFQAFRPNVAIDGFVCKHLSIGLYAGLGGGSYRNASRVSDSSGTQTSENSSSSASVYLAPRLGVAFTHASGFGVWVRGGMEVYLNSTTYQSEGPEGHNLSTSSDASFGVRGEVLGTYSPVAHVVLMAGPNLRAGIDANVPAMPILGLNVNAGMFF